MNFADKLATRIKNIESCLCAGIDPRPELMPDCFIQEADKESRTTEEFIYQLLTNFYFTSLEAIKNQVACTKPNAAFFEQYGIAGIKALQSILSWCKEQDIPTILDAKRGDIGSTAEAYSRSILGKQSFLGRECLAYEADSMTVNPFLGFDTLEPFLNDCIEYSKGIFILVKTSNPGSSALQETTSDKIAKWIGKNSEKLQGSCGLSGLGAVVGATYPEEAKELRQLMPNSFFLIPGLGAQGGTISDAKAGFTSSGKGGVVNASRGIFSKPEYKSLDKEKFLSVIKKTTAVLLQ
ncbi:MAG: orotidine-5'-phosphate decarboxylase [Bdellovibrionota bacterium]